MGERRGIAKLAGWSKGLTVATDARVARMARSLRGRKSWSDGLTAATDTRVAAGVEKRRGRKRGPYKIKGRAIPASHADALKRLAPEQRDPYLHLLGLYLGDGSIVAKTKRLEIVLDRQYPDLVQWCADSMRAVHPRGKANVRARGPCMVVNSYDPSWLLLIPQAGAGRKHLRHIELTAEQKALVRESPLPLLRGLIESDGSRYDHVVGGRAYPSYDFTNVSADIREIFCWAADLLGVHYTTSGVHVSVARRADVGFLDARLPRKAVSVLERRSA